MVERAFIRYAPNMPLLIRRASARDIPAITQIYNESGVATTASYDIAPVSVSNRRLWFDSLVQANHPVLVAESDGEILGFANYGAFRPKAGYDRTVEHTVYVRQGSRAGGCGRMLMSALIDHARGQGVHVMIGMVDAENEASLAFHRRLGFVEVGRLPEVGRKFDRWLDLVIMALHFG